MVRSSGAFVHRQSGTETVIQVLALILFAFPFALFAVGATTSVLGVGPAWESVLGMAGGCVIVASVWSLWKGALDELDELGNPIPRGVVLAVDDRGVLVGALFTRRRRLVRWSDVTGLRMISRSTGTGESGTREEFASFLLVSRQHPTGQYTVSLSDMDISRLGVAVRWYASPDLVLEDERVRD